MITDAKAKVPQEKDDISQGAIYKNVKYNYIESESDNDVKVIEYEFPLAVIVSQACDVISMEQLLISGTGKAIKFMPSVLMCPIYDKQTAKNGEHIQEAFNTFKTTIQKDVLFNSNEYKIAEKNWHYRYHPFKASVNGKTVIEDTVIDFKHYFTVPMSYLIINRKDRILQLEDLFAEQITLKFASYLTRVPIPE